MTTPVSSTSGTPSKAAASWDHPSHTTVENNRSTVLQYGPTHRCLVQQYTKSSSITVTCHPKAITRMSTPKIAHERRQALSLPVPSTLIRWGTDRYCYKTPASRDADCFTGYFCVCISEAGQFGFLVVGSLALRAAFCADSDYHRERRCIAALHYP